MPAGASSSCLRREPCSTTRTDGCRATPSPANLTSTATTLTRPPSATCSSTASTTSSPCARTHASPISTMIRSVVYGVGLIADPQQRLLSRVGDESKSELRVVHRRQPGGGQVRDRTDRPHRLAGRRLPASCFSDYGACSQRAARHLRSRLRRRAFQQAGLRGQQTKQRQIGIYAQEQAKLFDKLVVVLGGRYDMAQFGIRRRQRLRRIHNQTRTGLYRPRRPRLSVRQRACALFQLFGVLRSALETDADGNPFKPEEGRQYEVGIKYQPQGKKVS